MSDNSLTWKDLNNITWEELGALNVTWNDLTLLKVELLKKIQNQDAPVPPSVYKKIKSICESVPEELKPKLSVTNSIQKIGGAILLILEALEHTEWLTEHAQELIDVINSILDYFS